MKRNLTVQLDESTIKDAKIIAAKRSMSLSGLISDEIRRLALREASYERTKASALARLTKGFDLGGGNMPSREEIHKR